MFLNKYENKLDSKKRCVVPAKFRRELGDSCVVMLDYREKCLYMYTVAAWERYVAEEIEILPEKDPDAQKARDYVYNYARECDIDDQGRISIPKDLLEGAEIEREMVNVGQMKRIKISATDKYESNIKDVSQKSEELFEGLLKYDPKVTEKK